VCSLQVDANHGVRNDGGRGRSGDKWWLRDRIQLQSVQAAVMQEQTAGKGHLDVAAWFACDRGRRWRLVPSKSGALWGHGGLERTISAAGHGRGRHPQPPTRLLPGVGVTGSPVRDPAGGDV